MLILGKGSKDGLEITTLTTEAQYSVNFTEQQKKLCLSLYYNRSNSFLFLNGVKTYQFQPKYSEINS